MHPLVATMSILSKWIILIRRKSLTNSTMQICSNKTYNNMLQKIRWIPQHRVISIFLTNMILASSCPECPRARVTYLKIILEVHPKKWTTSTSSWELQVPSTKDKAFRHRKLTLQISCLQSLKIIFTQKRRKQEDRPILPVNNIISKVNRFEIQVKTATKAWTKWNNHALK